MTLLQSHSRELVAREREGERERIKGVRERFSGVAVQGSRPGSASFTHLQCRKETQEDRDRTMDNNLFLPTFFGIL